MWLATKRRLEQKMTDKAKNSRRIAKGNFTRKRNILIKSIETSQGIEVVETNYSKLVDAWEELEGKHLEYVNFLTDEHLVDEEEIWMTEVEEKYSNAFNRKVKYVENVTTSEKATREHAARQEAIDNAKVKRNTARAVFEASYESISHALQSKEMPNFALKDLQKQIEDQFQDCKTFNAELLELLPFESAESEMQWIAKIQTYYYGIVEQIVVRYTNVKEQEQIKQESDATSSFLQLEKVKMPHFDGELRHYPQFKRDFNKQVMPQIRGRDAAYVLRSCLGKEPEGLVKSIDDDVQEMWRRLDEKYGDPAKIADVIIDGIRRFRTLKEGEDKRFIEFVTLVEDGYRDLTRLGLEAEITTTSSVSIIEKALSTDIRRKWAEMVSCHGSHIDKSKKFPSLLEFLQNQRSAIEYDSASLRTTTNNQHYRGTSHYTEGVEEVSKEPKPKCLIHEHGRHWTADCRIYLAKPIEEKKTIIKDKRACWSCLKIGHRQRTCKSRKDCGVGGCTRKHHPSIHETEETPQQVSASANVCHNTKIDTCLLQVQRVKTKRGEANIMWDNAASLCFITNTKAKQEKLKGSKVELSVIKVGAQSEKIKTIKYKVPLIDNQGHVIEFEAYGIERITSDIESVNIDDIVHLFKNVTKEEIERPSGPVDILIGYEYAAYHPEREQNIGHLVLLRNRFGRCIGGTHPLLKESHLYHDFINARVNTVVGKINIEDFYKIENLGVECKPKSVGVLDQHTHISTPTSVGVLDQHTHRFLWRDMDSTREPDTYIMLRVSFGDKPSATIATVALRKTAEMSREKYPEAADIIQRNTYMDDIIESMDDRKQAIKLTQDIEKAIIKGGFEVKEWMFSSDTDRQEKTNIPIEEQTEKILGVKWSQSEDQLCFEVKVNFTTKRIHTSRSTSDIVPTQDPQQLTKRIILSQINSVYDPLGLAGPFTVRAKILLRRLWGTEPKLDWDDPIPEENQQNWSIFFNDLKDMNQIRFTRCLKPMDAIGDPILVVFSDASKDAYAACAYVRWQRKNNQFESNLILSKNRLAPIKKMSIDRIELCGAVLNKRLKVFIEKECRYRFEKIYHIVDSQIVHAMIQKSSYGFNTFAATRIGEIQEGTNPENWYWVESKYNIADCLTRGRKPDDIGLESTWQKGPDFLKQTEDKWPITRDYLEPKLPEVIRTTMVTKIEGPHDTLALRIDIAKYSSYGKLLRVTARILKFYSKFPKPSHLYVAQTHARGHHGILTTASKVRTKYWIPKLLKLVKSIKFRCVICKKLAKKTSQQVMGQLPEDRLKPAPPWYSTGIDLFGPFKIRDEVKKRTFSKAYGVIFNCLGTRAVYLDLAADYSTDKFLMVLRRFVSLNGYPSKLLSDNGTQLIAASKELTAITKTWDWKKIKEYGVMKGLQWIFTPADAPWQNGVTEALIRSVKRAIEFSVGENALTFSELQTVLFEIANLLNERPIGRHPTSPEDGAYLCPNDLLLGRATSRIPNGPFDENANTQKRFTFVQTIVHTFWKKWNSNYFPSLILRQKWHTSHRNLKIGDVVMIQDSNLVRGNWKLGKVSNVYPGADGKVRRVDVQYKNLTVNEPMKQYQGKGYVTVQRPVQRLVLLIPIDENKINF